MTAINKIRHGTNTLVAKANHDALVARSRKLAEHANALGNSRIGIVLVTEVVTPIANALNDDLTKLYDTTIHQFPKADRSELQVACREGLDAYITACAPIGRNSPGFSESRMEVFTRTLADEAVRLRDGFNLKLSNVIAPEPKGWQKRLIEDHPVLWQFVIVAVVGGAIAAAIVKKMLG
jgi:hypothetical protein